MHVTMCILALFSAVQGLPTTAHSWADIAIAIHGPAPADEIVLAADFECNYFGAITINNGMSVSIFGNGATLDANNGKSMVTQARRFFTVDPGGALTLSYVTMRNGNASVDGIGGAILNHGTLNVNGATFIANSANYGGAIHNSGSLNVNTTSFSTNTATTMGGAIYTYLLNDNSRSAADGDVTVAGRSTFTRNIAPQGEDIFNDQGTVTFDACGVKTAMAGSTLPGNLTFLSLVGKC